MAIVALVEGMTGESQDAIAVTVPIWGGVKVAVYGLAVKFCPNKTILFCSARKRPELQPFTVQEHAELTTHFDGQTKNGFWTVTFVELSIKFVGSKQLAVTFTDPV